MLEGRGPLVAVVLAGGGPGDRLARAVGAPSKALVPYGARPLGEYVLAALRGSGVVDRTVLVGETHGRFAGLYDVNVPSGARLVDSLALGLGAALAQVPAADDVLLVTADVPWLTPEAVKRFVVAARAMEGADGGRAQLVYPVVERADAEAQFPGQRRTYAGLEDGHFTGGNLVLVTRGVVPALLPLIDRVFSNRKNPLALAGIVGPGTLARFLLGRARVAQLEARVSALLGAAARALPTRDACLAADVDDPRHLADEHGPPATLAGGGGPPATPADWRDPPAAPAGPTLRRDP